MLGCGSKGDKKEKEEKHLPLSLSPYPSHPTLPTLYENCCMKIDV